ncbi:hypothetical protein NC796_18600 [Aliifodinibius sp. S!AR15-10]|uniref:hypothetical protein n=1 Tax=Aliifodinibius sp. S!AR15-10 TaxID=2950437 RepID=UPI00286752AC|nr:hypothetical protein [Aliifodinibius sp. S!AR15-10]MDR8393172.1 hypothetical protein [Aliifodinibius sp. S!AR15-10]
MRKIHKFIAVLLLCTCFALETYAQNNIPSKAQQIKAAVSAAPANKQDGAKVFGYTQAGELTTLREASNELICLADDPQNPQFHVVCYYQDLEPFMKRGRELRAEGLSRSKVDSIRKVEIEAGELYYPEKPMALYSLSGPEDAFDYEEGKVKKANPLYVVYVPYATEESTGISSAPAGKGGSWLMEPGTPWAHIMFPGRPIEAETADE